MQPVFIVGPTAVGKTTVAMDLAQQLGAEIVSADSMQVYRGLDIGTAKPTLAERAAVRHHLIDICDPGATFDVKQYAELATNAIRSIQQRGKTALVVGGTGLYIRALRQGLFEGPKRNPELRAKLEVMTAETLFSELQRLDPATAATIDRHNPRRLVRALEVFYTTGKPISELQRVWGRAERASRPVLDGATADSPAAPAFCLSRDREDLYARIERRIDAQLAAGWLAEVRRLVQSSAVGISPDWTAWQAAGYRELGAHVRGELSLTEAVGRIKTRTRQLARRQLTWFRREPGLTCIQIARDEQASATARRMVNLLKRSEETTA